jgi:ubiquinone/menaquinone biosynthesis C-methylase UbiE
MQDYLQDTKSSVDRIAGDYDNVDSSNKIIHWMRSVVQNIYLCNFHPGQELLELNAGTGIDAVYLSQKGIKVFATDISPRMIDILRVKVANEKLENFITAEPYSFSDIDKIEKSDFDGVISNFGGLNCISDFNKLSDDLACRLNEGGKFIAAVMNKFCPWEIFYFLLKLDVKNAFRRFKKNGILADFNGEKVRTFYFYQKQFGRCFSRDFEIERIYTLALYTPSPYLMGIYNRFTLFVKLMMKIDNLIKGVFPFNRFGDHFIIVLRKRSG